jgi:hypothetical protein
VDVEAAYRRSVTGWMTAVERVDGNWTGRLIHAVSGFPYVIHGYISQGRPIDARGASVARADGCRREATRGWVVIATEHAECSRPEAGAS